MLTPSAQRPHPPFFGGTSGWAYASWKPGFYPKDVPAKRFLQHYATRLNSVEVNYTFRALPTASMLEGWLAATPTDFRFSFKAPQRITHFQRLRESAASLAQFFAGIEPVRAAGRLGLILFQLPPNFKVDPGLLGEFLAQAAASSAASSSPMRMAFEFRHESWFAQPIYDVLSRHGAALCIAEGDDLATPEVQCAATFSCYRLRRSGGYTQPELEALAAKLLALDREVFAYLRHEDEPTGALNAEALLQSVATQRAAPRVAG